MSYEVLTVIVVINAIMTLSLLWQSRNAAVKNKSTNRPSLTKEGVKEFWKSDPIVPRHNPPKVAGGEFHGLADEIDERFFADFKDFADVVNWQLAEESKSPFRLQDLPDGDTSLYVRYHEDGGAHPTLGRSFTIYYNQTEVGRLEIRPGYPYSTESRKVFTSIQLNFGRFFGFSELTQFLEAIAEHVTSPDPKSDEYVAARQTIRNELTQTLWDNYRVSQYDRADSEDDPELNLSFQGSAEFYIDRRDARARDLKKELRL
jgi:hypothetical protein